MAKCGRSPSKSPPKRYIPSNIDVFYEQAPQHILDGQVEIMTKLALAHFRHAKGMHVANKSQRTTLNDKVG